MLYSAGRIFETNRHRALAPGSTPIGREVGDAGVELSHDTKATRVHALVSVSADGTQVEIADQGSKNGLYVNGHRTESTALHEGDLIRIGRSLLLLRYRDAASAEVEPPPWDGQAPAVVQLKLRVEQVAKTKGAVLILGESGVGKDVTARAVHAASGRSGALIPINCAAIPAELAESQLFGHQAGAFSGATGSHEGYFLSAHQGTLFLDEIGDLPLAQQPKLLRAMEEGLITKVGAKQPQRCDVRIVAATNRDLDKAVQQGSFRGDLLARLQAHVLRVPPLRERREDILPLVKRALPPNAPPLTAALAEALLLFGWPYNVRQLLQLATDLGSRCQGESELDVQLVSEQFGVLPEPAVALERKPPASAPPPATPVEGEIEKETLERLLLENQGVVARVARALGYSSRQINRWLKKYNLHRRDFLPGFMAL